MHCMWMTELTLKKYSLYVINEECLVSDSLLNSSSLRAHTRGFISDQRSGKLKAWCREIIRFWSATVTTTKKRRAGLLLHTMCFTNYLSCKRGRMTPIRRKEGKKPITHRSRCILSIFKEHTEICRKGVQIINICAMYTIDLKIFLQVIHLTIALTE